MKQRSNEHIEHLSNWLDSEHTQFLYWIHQEYDTWRAMILTPDRDMPREILDEIAKAYHNEDLNERYQRELIDYKFVLKRKRYEEVMAGKSTGEADEYGKKDPYEELEGPIDSILAELFPEEFCQNDAIKEKFRWVLDQLLPQQVQLLYDHFISNKSMTQIAEEENAKNGTNIRRQAITNRMDKIYLRIEKLMPEFGPTKPRVNFRKKDE